MVDVTNYQDYSVDVHNYPNKDFDKIGMPEDYLVDISNYQLNNKRLSPWCS